MLFFGVIFACIFCIIFALFLRQNQKTYYNIDPFFVKLTEVNPVENKKKIILDFALQVCYTIDSGANI